MDLHGILGIDPDVRNGFSGIRVTLRRSTPTPRREDIEAIVAQSQKRSAVFDIVTNPTNVTRRGRLSSRHRERRARHAHRRRRSSAPATAGLAMSHRLSRASIDHVVLERGEVANSWRTERWDSLRLLTPNWMTPAARATATRATIPTAT